MKPTVFTLIKLFTTYKKKCLLLDNGYSFQDKQKGKTLVVGVRNKTLLQEPVRAKNWRRTRKGTITRYLYILKKKKKGTITRHNREKLRCSTTCPYPWETTGRKFHYNREITMVGLKTLSLGPNPRYTQVQSLTQILKPENRSLPILRLL